MSGVTRPTTLIKTRAAAGAAVKEISHLAVQLGTATARRDADVLQAQTKHAGRIGKITNESLALSGRVEAWARANRAKEFGEAQSLELPHGTLVFRVGQRALDELSGWTFKKTLKAMLAAPAAWRRWLRVKKEINKAQILIDASPNPKTGDAGVLTAEKLRGVGVRVVQGESFEIVGKA